MRFTRSTILCLGAAALGAWLVAPCPAGAQPAPPPAAAQPGVNGPAQQVQLAVPFGSLDGQLVLSGQNLMFIDQQHPGGSFTVARDNIRTMNLQGSDLNLDLIQPVRDNAGQTTRLVFRMNDPAGAQNFMQWFHETQPSTGTADRAAAPSRPDVLMSFEVKHDHFIGSDSGRLLVTPTQLVYESVTSVDNSRQWNLSDIKEVKLNGPYKLKVVPFSGDEYNFNLLGQGMSTDQYHKLVDEVTRARVPRR